MSDTSDASAGDIAGDSESDATRLDDHSEASTETEPSGLGSWLSSLVGDDTDDGGSSASTSAGSAGVDENDLGPPYLFVDQYSGDSGARPPWETLVNQVNYYGAILKAWEGLRFDDGGWFRTNWPAVRDVGGDRYGQSWFRGAYLFLKFLSSGADQADAYLGAVEAAGGWGEGDILPIVDVELGGETNSNRKASAQQVIDCVTECANRLRDETGRRVMLYGRGAMRDLGINDRMGCDVAWNPSYTATMVRNGLQAWDLEEIVLWQYCGDNFAAFKKLPNQVPGFRKVDISVFIKGAQEPTLEDVRDALLR